MKKLLFLKLISLESTKFKLIENNLYIVGKVSNKLVKLNLNTLQQINTLKTKIQKVIIGLEISYIQRLLLLGVGYRLEKQTDRLLSLKLGYSHTLFFVIPKEIDLFLSKKKVIICKSLNFEALTLFISQLQKLRKFNKYKGKGFIKKNQIIKLKEGKKKK